MRIVIAMSGGVDSSVAAAMLARAGHEVIGLSMQLYDQREGQESFGSCCTLDDLHDARRVAAAIGIPHYIVNLEKRFESEVVANFVREYAAGRTPLPCAHCNSELKFSTLLDRAIGLGAEAVATGHYARVERDPWTGRYLLKRGTDPGKDQSYFLFSLKQAQLGRALFPLGGLHKDDVREYARQWGLPVADKRDSQEICFVAGNDYTRFVADHAPDAHQQGFITDEGGKVLGRHDGIYRFTVGQRKRLGLSSADPLYVTKLSAATNTVVVGPRDHLQKRTLTAAGVNWIDGSPPAGVLPVMAQIRYRHPAATAALRALDDDRAELEFDEPQLAIAPGQAAVFYVDDVVIGGGWID
jgi:tRNA-specific 2-thiouridylase